MSDHDENPFSAEEEEDYEDEDEEYIPSDEYHNEEEEDLPVPFLQILQVIRARRAMALARRGHQISADQLREEMEQRAKDYAELCRGLPINSDCILPGNFAVETKDHDDHTFSGIMFDLQCRFKIPIDFVEIQGFSVRGWLGEMSVYTTPVSYHRKDADPEQWNCVYKAVHEPSPRELVELKLNVPIRLASKMSIGVYIHSTRPDDMAIVYDEVRSTVTYEDDYLRLLPGQAHLSNVPFSEVGVWGVPWRGHRQFVGKVRYGVRYKLWSPSTHVRFPRNFRKGVWTMLLCHTRKHENPHLYSLPRMILFQIFNMMSYDWFGGLDPEELEKDSVPNEEVELEY
jgi:hypothetical protein